VRRVAVLLLMVAVTAMPANAQAVRYVLERIAPLEFPTAIAPTADGSIVFVAERAGRIRLLRDDRLAPDPVVIIATSDSGEGGLLGLALDPRFDQGEPWLYLFYTLPDGSSDRVVRMRYANGRAGEAQRLMPSLPSGAAYHHGGILTFGPDGKLYISNGEAHRRERAQDPKVFGGKIYRINPDGSIPDDNPFPGSPTWSYGHRNPFGLAFDPETGRLWESENGPENHDEVNLIKRGGNYGWPALRGAQGSASMEPAKIDYADIVVPTGLAFSPPTFTGSGGGALFMGTFTDGIHRLRLNEDRTEATDAGIVNGDISVVGLARGRDAIYVTTPDTLYRLTTDPATTPSPNATPSTAPVPEPGDAVAGILFLTAAGVGGYFAARALRRTRRPRPPGPWLGGRSKPG
jgi:glucose/arabinose dehydrogenase